MLKILVVEHLDPSKLVPSGIDTIVHDFARFSDSYTFDYVGVTDDAGARLGEWQDVFVAGKLSRFLPVAYFDRSVKRRGLRIPHSLLFILGILRYRNRIKGFHFHTHRVETGWAVCFLLKGTLTQYIHNDSAGLLGDHSDSVWRRLGWIYKLLERCVLKRAAGVAVFNRTDAPRLQAIRPEVEIAHTWYDPMTFFPATERPAGPPVVTWVGRLDEQKDPELAIEVAREIKASGLDWTLRIVGEGPARPSLEAAIVQHELHDVVQLLGARSRHDVAMLLRQSHMFLMTSHYEGSPTVLVEALASGLPAVCTDGADPDLLLTEDISGKRVRERSPKKIVEALRGVADYTISNCASSVAHRSAEKTIPGLLKVGVVQEVIDGS